MEQPCPHCDQPNLTFQGDFRERFYCDKVSVPNCSWGMPSLSEGHTMGIQGSTLASHQPLGPSQIADLRLAAPKMTVPKRRTLTEDG